MRNASAKRSANIVGRSVNCRFSPPPSIIWTVRHESVGAATVDGKFVWSNTDYANIAAVFQFVYAISMLFAGRFVDKIGTKKAYIVAIGVWSTGAVMHAFAVPMGEGIGCPEQCTWPGCHPGFDCGFYAVTRRSGDR